MEGVLGIVFVIVLTIGIMIWQDKQLAEKTRQNKTITQAEFERKCFEERCTVLANPETEKHYKELLKGTAAGQRLEIAYKDLRTVDPSVGKRISLGGNYIGKKPMNPYTAGGLASAIGGNGLGAVVALEQMEKQKQYEQGIRANAEWRRDMALLMNQIDSKYVRIEKIIESIKRSREEWNITKENIREKLSKEWYIKETLSKEWNIKS